MASIQYHEDKFSELILYISEKSATDPHFGATKLNKILYFSDFLAYGKWGEPITGAEYQNLPQGPAPRKLLPARTKLISSGELVLQPVVLFNGLVQQRTVNLREPNLSLFRGNEISVVDQVIERLSGLTASQASDLSHLDTGWKFTAEGETIDYRTVFLSDDPLTEAELRYVRGVLAEEEIAA